MLPKQWLIVALGISLLSLYAQAQNETQSNGCTEVGYLSISNVPNALNWARSCGLNGTSSCNVLFSSISVGNSTGPLDFGGNLGSYVNDGNSVTFVSNLIDTSPSSWFAVDFEQVRLVATGRVWNRQALCSTGPPYNGQFVNACLKRLRYFQIWVGNSSTSPTNNTLCHSNIDPTGLNDPSTNFSKAFTCGISGRYAFINFPMSGWFSFGELEFYGPGCDVNGVITTPIPPSRVNFCPINSRTNGTICLPSAGFYDLGSSLIAYYPFNSDEFLSDISGRLGSLIPSFPSPISQSSGPLANSSSAYLNASRFNYFVIPPLRLPNSFTICLWFFVAPTIVRNWPRFYDFGTTVNSFANVIAGSGGSSTDIQSTMHKNQVNLGDARVTGGTATTSTWSHVCIGLNGRAESIWVNGVLRTSLTISDFRDTNVLLTSNFIGQSNYADAWWDGAFDEFRIYNRLLTATEVLAVYNFKSNDQNATRTTVMPLSCAPSCAALTFGHCTPTGGAICCGAGTFFVDGVSTVCQTCPPGYVGDGSSSSCNCAAGTFFDGSVCISCALGTHCPVPSTSARQCPIGTFCSTPATSVQCPIGTFCPSGSISAQQCPVGFFCPNSTIALNCSIGSFCPSGTITQTQCPAGSFCPNTTVSIICPAGFFCIIGTVIPQVCSSGAFCPQGSSNAQPCSAGFYCSDPSVSLICTVGAFCPNGTVTPELCSLGAFCPRGLSAPQQCPASFYCPNATISITCTLGSFCPSGTVIPQVCPPGSFCTTGLSAAQLCPLGSFCPNSSVFIACSLGSFCPTGTVTPQPCPLGSFCQTPSKSELCQPKSYCPIGSTMMMQCPASTYCPDANQSIICPEGNFCPIGTITPQECPIGAYCPISSSIIRQCPRGTYCPNASVSLECPIGTSCPEGSSSLQPCPAGFYCTDATTAVACASGTMCPPGTVIPQLCPIGNYCPSTSSILIIPCPVDSYCPAVSGAPIPCVGETTSLAASTSLNDCKSDLCSGNTFFMPSLNGSAHRGVCVPVPQNAVPVRSGMRWKCGDGTIGTHSMRKYNLPCTAYSFSSSLLSSPICGPNAAATLSEGYTNIGWCVSCQVPGNCPGAWAQVDLGLEGNAAGLYVAGRQSFCNYPLTLTVQHSLDGMNWTNVDNGFVFSTGLQPNGRCAQGFDDYSLIRPLSIISFSQPIITRYLRVFPLTHAGLNSEFHRLSATRCMTFEPLTISDSASSLLVAYTFTNQANWAQNWGSLGSAFNLTSNSGASWADSSLTLRAGQFATSPPIDFTDVSEFTLTYWISVSSFSCNTMNMAVGLLDDTGKWFFGAAPCYGTSFMKVTMGSTNTVNGFGWGQRSGYNFQIVHGRRAGNRNFFWVGQAGGSAYTSNGMSTNYEFFNLPRWPRTLTLSLGSNRHVNVIHFRDVRLYKDLSLTGSIPGQTGRVPMDATPSLSFNPSLNHCAICQPGFYCKDNQQFRCPPNSSAGFQASDISQCMCFPTFYNESQVGCRPCRTGFYCPNQTAEIPCTTSICPGFSYESRACSITADRICSTCPNVSSGNTPAACVCPVDTYNNGTGCSACPMFSSSPLNSFGLVSCSCLESYFATTITDTRGNVVTLECKLCPSNTYSIARTKICFSIPMNTIENGNEFICPNATFLPRNVPVLINSSGFPIRPGILYWSFDNINETGLMNEWGNYTAPWMSSAPRPFPGSTTSDIQALNPNVRCRFGPGCALIGGTVAVVYNYPFVFQQIPMPTEGLTVSYWFRINSCVSCSYWNFLRYATYFSFAGVVATHDGVTTVNRFRLTFTYNSVTSPPLDIFGSTQFDGYKDRWNHHMFCFLPGGRFLAYVNGALMLNTSFNASFPSHASGSFFAANYINVLIDDFAIFRGNMGPYVANFQDKTAAQALDAIAIGESCVPCYPGMYCSNNSATRCPLNTTVSEGNGVVQSDCLCNNSGRINTPACNVSCPANWYCPGLGIAPIQCPKNRLSAPGSTSILQCICPPPFVVHASGQCACPSQINADDPSGTGCICGPGYTGHPALDFVPTRVYWPPQNVTIGPLANQTMIGRFGNPVTFFIPNFNLYPQSGHDVWSNQEPMAVFDGVSSSVAFFPLGSQLVVDLGGIYFIPNITFLPSSGCENMQIGVGMLRNRSDVSYIHQYRSATTPVVNGFRAASNLNTHARYITFAMSPVNTGVHNYMREIRVMAMHPACTLCPAGSFCPTNDTNSIQICTAGHYCPPGVTAPLPCGFNFFSSSGASLCRPCPAHNAITFTPTATTADECICGPGTFGTGTMTTRAAPQFSVGFPWSKTNNIMSSLRISNDNRALHSGRLDKEWLPDPLSTISIASTLLSYWYNPPYANDNPPGFTNACHLPVFYQYDLLTVHPLTQIYASTPVVGGWSPSPCGVYVQISLTGDFTGEETTVYSCRTFADCPQVNTSSRGYNIFFPVQNARYVRFYTAALSLAGMGAQSSGTFVAQFQSLLVYRCEGAGCSSCIPCASNSYCPGTRFNETYPCPNSSFVAPGATNVSQCVCPLNSMVIPRPENNLEFACGCNAGFYRENTHDTSIVPFAGWRCLPCVNNMTSLPGAMNYTQCFCSSGLYGIPLIGNATLSQIVKPRGISNSGNAMPGAKLWAMTDDIADLVNYLNYPFVAIGCNALTFWIQYDLLSQVSIASVTLKIRNGFTLAQCRNIIAVSSTGSFTGEQQNILDCGSHSGRGLCPGDPPVRGNSIMEYNTSMRSPVIGRFVRWYHGGTLAGEGIGLLQMTVYRATSAYRCTSCMQNNYCPSQTLNEIIQCPNNTYSLPGASSTSQCTCPRNSALRTTTNNCTCNAGFYALPNATAPMAGWQCNACPTNLSSPEGASSLSQCVCAGGFYPTTSPTTCAQCTAGTYCPFPNTGPMHCPAGLASVDGALACTLQCPAGFHCPGNGQVIQCPTGTYSTGGAGAECITCEPGFYCNVPFRNFPCPSGSYCPLGSNAPILCPIGSYALESSAAACSICEPGYYCPNSTTRILCPVLFYCLGGSTEPTPCRPGLYSCAGSPICTIACPPGGYCPGNGTVIPCPMGTFSNGSATTGCIPCPEGFFCDMSLQLTAAGCV